MAPCQIIDIITIKKSVIFKKQIENHTFFHLTHLKSLDIITAEKQRIKISQT